MSVVIVFAIFAFVVLTITVESKARNSNHTIFFIFDTAKGLKLLFFISFMTVLSVVLFAAGVSSINDYWILILISLASVLWIYVYLVGKRNVEVLGKLYGTLATFCLFVIMCAIGVVILILLMIVAGALSDKNKR